MLPSFKYNWFKLRCSNVQVLSPELRGWSSALLVLMLKLTLCCSEISCEYKTETL